MRCSRIKMATRSLAYGSHCVLKLTLSLVLLIGTATSVNAGLNDFRWTSAEESIRTLRKRPKWETSESQDEENRPDDTANEKSEWQKEIEEISRMEREKWEKYRTENPKSLPTAETQITSIENFDKEFWNSGAENTTTYRSKGEDQSRVFKEIMSAKDKGEDFLPGNEMQNGRWGMRKKHEPASKQLPVESRVSEKSEKAERDASDMADDFTEGMKFFSRKNHTTEIGGEELIESGNKVENRSKEIENGRWGMSGGNQPPLGVRVEIFRRKIMVNNGDTEARRSSKEIAKFMRERTRTPGEDIWGEMREVTEAEKFLDDISRSKNIAGVQRDVESRIRRLKSARENLGDEKYFIPESRNEYWMNKDPGTSEGTLGNSRRTLATEGLPNSERNGEKLNPRPAGIRKLIQIIISAYTGDVQNGVEVSIDQLIPGSNGVSSLTELHPIVIGLSPKKLR